MLQWMGGSRRKVTSSRKSIHNRQKQYFEQRKRQQQIPGLEILSDAQKQIHYHEVPRSQDIRSLINLATDSQQGYFSKPDELDVSQAASHFSQFSPENAAMKVTSKFLEGFEKSCSKPGTFTPTKVSAENIQNVPTFHGDSSNIDKQKVQSSPCRYASNNIYKPTKQEDEAQNEVSVLGLLADDGPNNVLDGGPVCEAHVAFSVEGLGKVGIRTPTHSPRQYNRNLLSPVAPMQMRSLAKHKLEIKTNILGQNIMKEQDSSPLEHVCNRRGILDNEFSNERGTMFTFSCMSSDAYENQNSQFSSEEESFFTGCPKNHPWKASWDMIDDSLLNNKYGAKGKNKPSYTERSPFTFNAKMFDSPDFEFEEASLPSSRALFREDKSSTVSGIGMQL